MNDEGPQGLPPLAPRTAALLCVWVVGVAGLWLAVRELGLRLVP